MPMAAKALWRRPGGRGLIVALAVGAVLTWDSLSRFPAQAQDVPFPPCTKTASGLANAGATGAAVTAREATDFINGMRLASEGKGTGRTPLVKPTDVAVGDYTGDGCDDVAVVDRTASTGQLQILVGGGDGTFGFWKDFSIDGKIVSVEPFRADADQFFDIAIGVTGERTGVQVYTGAYMAGGAPGPTFVPTEMVPLQLSGSSSLGPVRVNLGAANGTVPADALSTSGTFAAGGPNVNDTDITQLAVWQTSTPSITDQVQATPLGVTVVDNTLTSVEITPDGLLVGSRPGTYYLSFEALGSSNMVNLNGAGGQGSVLVDSAPSPSRIVTGDFNGDGAQDLAAVYMTPSGQTRVRATPGTATGFQANGAAPYNDDVILQQEANAGLLNVGDPNGDGRTDLLVTSATLDDIEVLPGDGSGGFGPPVRVPGGGLTTFYSTLGMFSDGTTEDITESATWTSSPGKPAVVGGPAVQTQINNRMASQVAGDGNLADADRDWFSVTLDNPTDPAMWGYDDDGNPGEPLPLTGCVGGNCGGSITDDFSACSFGDDLCTPPSECLEGSCLDLSDFCADRLCGVGGALDRAAQDFFSGGYTYTPQERNSTVTPTFPGQGALARPPDGVWAARLLRGVGDWLLPAPLAADEPTVAIVANGASLGQSLEVQITDASGQIKTMAMPGGVVLQPLQGRANVYGANARLPRNTVRQEVGAFCMNFAKEPPRPGQAYRFAPPEVQQQFASLKKVLQAADRVSGELHPDSEPGAYLNAIRQYSLWSKIENWDEAAFGKNFLERTKKNAQNAKVPWTAAMEATINRVVPGRWRDIQRVLAAAQ